MQQNYHSKSRKWLLQLTCFLACCNVWQPVYGQDEKSVTKSGVVYFHVGKYDFDPLFRNNAATMGRIISQIDTLNLNPETAVRSIKVSTSTSPDGGRKINVPLASDRSRSIVEYLMQMYPNLTQQIVISSELAPDWGMLREKVAASNMPQRDQVIGILDSYRNFYSDDINQIDPREKYLKQLDNGTVWKYMLDNYYPDMRYAKIELLHNLVDPNDRYIEQIVAAKEEPEARPYIEDVPVVEEPVQQAVVVTPAAPQYRRNFLLALKSNLLFDVFGALNGEIEIPVAKKWSIQAEAVWPWWVAKKDNWCEQMGLIDGEVRYWFGDRHIGNPVDPEGKINPLTGFFVGFTGGWGYYDFELHDRGYQGEAIVGGVTAGYSMRLSKHFNMEFSLGIGYLHSNFRRYHVEQIAGEEALVRKFNGHYNYGGPIKAKVSISWLLFNKKKIK